MQSSIIPDRPAFCYTSCAGRYCLPASFSIALCPMQVVIYTSPTCHFCHMAKEFFEANNIAYEERDVSNPEYAREMVERSGQMGVPVIFITPENGEEEMVVGFDEPRLRELLGV